MNYNDVISTIILTILGVSTIRWIISKLGILDRESKWARLIYDEYDSDLTRKILKFIGFSIDEVRNKISKLGIPEYGDSLSKVIAICVNNIQAFSSIKTYGKETPTQSKYYINTMEASHCDLDRINMAQALIELMGIECKPFPNFIITPKKGNPYLALELNKQRPNLFTVIIKDADESSFLSGAPEESPTVNYEGINYLISYANRNKDKTLYGVAIDCNASGGNNIKNAILTFNTVLENIKLNNITKIDKAIILFRPDCEVDIDEEYKNAGNLKLHRYFDLTEDIKEEIYKLKQKYKQLYCYNKNHRKNIQEIIKVINSNATLFYKEKLYEPQ